MTRQDKKLTASELISLIVFGIAIFTLTGLLFYSPIDYFAKEAARHPREVPFVFARALYSNLGIASYLIVIFAAFWSAIQFFRERVRAVGLKVFGILLLGCSAATLAGALASTGGDGARLRTGGMVGTFLSERLRDLFGPVGLYLVLVLFLGVSLIFVTDWFFVSLFRRATPALGYAGGVIAPVAIAPAEPEDAPVAASAEAIFEAIRPVAPVLERPAETAVDEVEAPDPSKLEGEEPAWSDPTIEEKSTLEIDSGPARAQSQAVEQPPIEEPMRRATEPQTLIEAEDREIELDPDDIVFEEMDDEDSESNRPEIFILGGRVDDDPTRAVAEAEAEGEVSAILEEVAEDGADEDGIEIEMGPSLAGDDKVSMPATQNDAEPEIEKAPAGDARAVEPTPAPVAEIPGDAERDEELARELAREWERSAETAAIEERPDSVDETPSSGDREDALYREAVRIVVEERRGSVSLIQRRLEIGYARATKFLDRMEKEGLVGPYEGAKARDVLVTPEEWEALG